MNLKKRVYHLESRWRNPHVLVYHGPLLSHLFGSCAIYFHYGVVFEKTEFSLKLGEKDRVVFLFQRSMIYDLFTMVNHHHETVPPIGRIS